MSTGAIARFVLKHKLLVVVAWVIVAAISFGLVSTVTSGLSHQFTLPGKEGAEISGQIQGRYGVGGFNDPVIAVVTLPEGTTVDSPGIKAQLTTAFDRITKSSPQTRVASYASTGDRAFVSRDGRTTFALAYLPSDETGLIDLPAIKEAMTGVTVAGAPVLLTGRPVLATESSSGGAGVLVELLIGGGGALLVLAYIFGSFLALLPILMAIVAIPTTFLLIGGVNQLTDVNFIVQFLIALIGLGVAIDYALLVVTRWREERAAGRPNEAAVQRAMETAGHAVVFSGTTVSIGLLALVVLPVPFMRSVGYAGMLIPLVSVVVTLTLLPVILATIGPKLDWPRGRSGHQSHPGWHAWATVVVRHRIAATVVALVVLGALLVPAFGITVGDPRPDALNGSGAAQQGLVALQDAGIPGGAMSPFQVLVQGGDAHAVATALDSVNGLRGAVAPAGAGWSQGGSSLVIALPDTDGSSQAARTVLDRVRDVAHAQPGQVGVGGPAAFNADFTDAVYGSFPLMVGLIALVTYILLVRAFRSLVLPLKALALNVLSVGAAYGVLVLIWQHGYGSEAIWGIPATGAITSWVPLMVFAFLFGLSMDYEVFILARMREEYDATGSTDRAIVGGLSLTGRLVTCAALILFLSFTGMASGPQTEIKMLATGLAAGIILDATVVRALLVPALISLMGHWNWWLPGWLERVVPHPESRATA
jgi:RND superfamily putative drug exporter